MTIVMFFACTSVALAILGERMRRGRLKNLVEWGAIVFSWLALVSSIVWTLEAYK